MENTQRVQDDPLLKDLTEPQRMAVTHIDGPLLVIAAAGSGKTRVITRRVAYMMSVGIAPPSILAITFTNKAAGEMKQRISAASPRGVRDWGRLDQPWPTICTFHSLCLRILRHYATALSLAPNFSIYDSSDQTRLIKQAIAAAELSADNFSPGMVHGEISNAKNKLMGPDDYMRSAGQFHQRTIGRAYVKYQKLLEDNNALDFDDLLMRAVWAMRDHDDIREQLQDRFRYILIDEYQDTNHAQYVLAHVLASKHRNICVVGDPDQSIYAWRGADIKNILDFETDYTDAAVVPLEQNYRSTQTILSLGDALIEHNLQRKKKRLWTENEVGDKAILFKSQDERDEGSCIAAQFKELHDRQGLPWNQMAVFYRMNSLSRVMEDALRRAGLPYQIARGVEFYGRKEIKDVLAYLRVISNPNDTVSLDRIINVPTRGIGAKSMSQVQVYAIAHGIGLWNALQQVESVPGLSARAVGALRGFARLIESLRTGSAIAEMPQVAPAQVAGAARQKPVDQDQPRLQFDILAPPVANIAEPKDFAPQEAQHITNNVGGIMRPLMERVIRLSGLEALYKKEAHEGEDQWANLNELISAAAEYDAENPEGSLEDYLARVSLVSDADQMKDSGGAITMMTMHAAKGLEFDVVAIIGLEEGCLPHSRADGSLEDLEEERRLCFVGITRARKHLILSQAARRMIRGRYENTRPSRFLFEMPPDRIELIDRSGIDQASDRDSERRQMNQESSELARQFPVGQKVSHPMFGVGEVTELSEMGQHTRAIVQFKKFGRKTLILQHAPLEAIY